LQISSNDPEESYHSLYYLGLIEENLGNKASAITHFLNAYTFRPSRAEPLFHIAKMYRESGNLFFGYLVSKFACSIPYPQHDLFVDAHVYHQHLPIEYANCALLLNRWEEGLQACQKILEIPELSTDIKSQVISNQQLARKNLEQQLLMSYQK
jgi:tetratricopeptide (TPR) repeat protein